MINCFFCNGDGTENSHKVKIRNYSYIKDKRTLSCCHFCRDNIRSFPDNIYAQKLSERLGSHLHQQIKRDTHNKTCSLVDFCCDIIVCNKQLFDAFVLVAKDMTLTVSSNMQNAILFHFRNRKTCTKMLNQLSTSLEHATARYLTYHRVGSTHSSFNPISRLYARSDDGDVSDDSNRSDYVCSQQSFNDVRIDDLIFDITL